MRGVTRALLVSLAVAACAFGFPWLTHFADSGVSLVLHLVWIALLVRGLVQFGWRGSWFLLGAPLALFWPAAVAVWALSDPLLGF
jgi:hypothetical protein